MKIFITSGGTKVPIDDVRHIGNMSSGRYGAVLASKFIETKEHQVHFLYAKRSENPRDYTYISEGWTFEEKYGKYLVDYEYEDYFDYVVQSEKIVDDEKPDIILSAAAVSDYIVDKTKGKISSDQEEITIVLKRAKKILPIFRPLAPNATIVGFKLLVSPTPEEKHAAIAKTLGVADMVVYNDLTQLRKGNVKRELHFNSLADNQIEYFDNLYSEDMINHIVAYHEARIF